jgi:hypothetical protein
MARFLSKKKKGRFATRWRSQVADAAYLALDRRSQAISFRSLN